MKGWQGWVGATSLGWWQQWHGDNSDAGMGGMRGCSGEAGTRFLGGCAGAGMRQGWCFGGSGPCQVRAGSCGTKPHPSAAVGEESDQSRTKRGIKKKAEMPSHNPRQINPGGQCNLTHQASPEVTIHKLLHLKASLISLVSDSPGHTRLPSASPHLIRHLYQDRAHAQNNITGMETDKRIHLNGNQFD